MAVGTQFSLSVKEKSIHVAGLLQLAPIPLCSIGSRHCSVLLEMQSPSLTYGLTLAIACTRLADLTYKAGGHPSDNGFGEPYVFTLSRLMQ